MSDNKNIKFYFLLVLMGVCLIPIFLLYNTHHKKLDLNINVITDSIIINFDNVEKDNSDVLYNNFSIDKNMVEEYIYYYPIDSMLVEEMLVIKLYGMSDLSYIKKAIDKHIEDKKKDFISYGVEQYSILLDAKIYDFDPYVVYVVHKDIKNIDKMIKDKFR